MPVSKPKPAKRRALRAEYLQSGILKQFDCEWISYDFEIPRGSFNLRSFSRKTGVRVGERWNTGVYPKIPATGYHAHFKGVIEKDQVRITVEYWDGAYSVERDYAAPHAEEIMAWIGAFVQEPTARAMIGVGFEKPNDKWRSRFNLPFRVTTSNDLELLIDGVSVLLPKNDYRAFHAYLSRTEKVLKATVGFAGLVRFADFDIAKEITHFDRAVNMFAEQVT
jgi:hypothetical protein